MICKNMLVLHIAAAFNKTKLLLFSVVTILPLQVHDSTANIFPFAFEFDALSGFIDHFEHPGAKHIITGGLITGFSF